MKILFLQKRPLFPTTTGGQIRTLNIVRHLAQWHDVTYLCNVLPDEEPHLGEMRNLGVRLEAIPWRETPRGCFRFYVDVAANLFSHLPFNVQKDHDARLRQRAEQLLRDRAYDLLICDFVQMATNAIGLAAPCSVLFQHNVESQIFERQSRHTRHPWRRWLMAQQWRKMHRFERQAGWQFDKVVAVSKEDQATFENDYGWPHVAVIDTSVDVHYFRPQDVSAEIPGRVVFVGSLDWLPNEEGVQHFVDHIWPLIRRQCPGATFHAIGRRPSPEVQRLSAVDGVTIVGSVPDVRPHLACASVVVVPLLAGGGTRLKIFEAMAMRKAVVSTPLGAEGLPVNHDEHLLLAESVEAFAAAVASLIKDAQKRRDIAQRAHRHVHANFTAEAVARQFEAICLDTVGSRERESKELTADRRC